MHSVLPALVLVALATPAASQDLFGVSAAGELVRIPATDPSQVTAIGPLGLAADESVQSLSYHASLQTLFAAVGRTITPNDVEYSLVEIVPTTLAAPVCGS
ncbi:MAG: hypothetical protein AAGB93_03275, partial [Planctomycetota bacterium]